MVNACARVVEAGEAETHGHPKLKARFGDMGPSENKRRIWIYKLKLILKTQVSLFVKEESI